MALAWAASCVFLAVVLTVFLTQLRSDAETKDELDTALWDYAVVAPGALLLTIAAWGLTPMLLVVPGTVYLAILVITRGHPLLMLGHTIDRVDRKVSDRYAVILILILTLGAILIFG